MTTAIARKMAALAFLTLVSIASLVPGTASAAVAGQPTAYNEKSQALTDKPVEGMPVSCQTRYNTELWEGLYDWGHFRTGNGATIKRANLFLGTGQYTWEDCLRPRNGYYTHTTRLIPENPDWVAIQITSEFTVPNYSFRSWGSFLDPKF